MRTEHNLSPEQLWTSGLLRIATNSHIANEVFEDIEEVGFLCCDIFSLHKYYV